MEGTVGVGHSGVEGMVVEAFGVAQHTRPACFYVKQWNLGLQSSKEGLLQMHTSMHYAHILRAGVVVILQ